MIKINSKYVAIAVILSGAVITGQQLVVSAQEKPISSSVCQKRIGILNNRSTLLENYKKSENQRYQVQRDKWSKRIAYASQWNEKDASNARSKLYDYDNKTNNLNTEIDTQATDYRYLVTSPLACEKSQKDVVNDALKKAAKDQKTLEKTKRDQTKFANDTFKKATDKMINSLHSAKEKNPGPRQKPFEVNKR